MKKIIAFLMLLLAVGTMPVMAAGFDLPDSLDLGKYFQDIGTMAAIVLPATQFVLRFIHTKYDQLMSWFVSLVLSVVAWFLGWGIFADASWYWIIIYAGSAGLVANGIFDVPLIKTILSVIPKKRKLAEN